METGNTSFVQSSHQGLRDLQGFAVCVFDHLAHALPMYSVFRQICGPQGDPPFRC